MTLFDKIVMKYSELEEMIRKYDDKELDVPVYRKAIAKAIQQLYNSEKWFRKADDILRKIYINTHCHPEFWNCLEEEQGDHEVCAELYCDEKAKKYFLGKG